MRNATAFRQITIIINKVEFVCFKKLKVSYKDRIPLSAPTAFPLTVTTAFSRMCKESVCFLPHSRAMLPPFQVSPLSEIKKQSIANGYALFLVRVTRLARRFHRRHAHVGENSPLDCFLPHSRAMLPPFQVSSLLR